MSFLIGPALLFSCGVAPEAPSAAKPQASWSWPESACPPGTTWIPAGTYQTGMRPPMPYGVVDTTQMERVENPQQHCEKAIATTPGASACWVQTDLADPIVTLHEATVEGYCMSLRPFPDSGPYPRDGLTTWDAQQFDRLLASGAYGSRRMCTYTEYEIAVSGPKSNLRFLYGNEADPSKCADSAEVLIGSRPECQNPETKLLDHGAVISQWVHLDEQIVAWACGEGQPCKASGGARLDARNADGSLSMRYVVAGGTHRTQTRQAPYTPHTFHDHGQPSGSEGCDTWGWDDGATVCANPDPRYLACAENPQLSQCEELRKWESSWSELLNFCQGRRMTDCLNHGLSQVTGSPVDVCPDSQGVLGPGQGR